MTDKFTDEPEDPELLRLLDNPDIWAEPSAEVEDHVIAAITAQLTDSAQPAEAGRLSDTAQPAHTSRLSDTGQPSPPADEDQSVVDLGMHRARRTGARRFWPLAAAAALLIVGISATAGFTLGRSDDSNLTTVAMTPTDRTSSASAIARIDERPNGARLLVDLSGLEPAPLGYFYEVWLVKAEPRTVISAGTFHMRGSDSGEIEFWAGVSPQIYRTITVTLESEAAPDAPGELILEGQVTAS